MADKNFFSLKFITNIKFIIYLLNGEHVDPKNKSRKKENINGSRKYKHLHHKYMKQG